MSSANPPWNATSAPGLPVGLQAAGRLASLVVDAIASAVVRRAARRACRELAALDDRTLVRIGLDRAAVRDLTAIRCRETWMSPAQFPWHRPRTSA